MVAPDLLQVRPMACARCSPPSVPSMSALPSRPLVVFLFLTFGAPLGTDHLRCSPFARFDGSLQNLEVKLVDGFKRLVLSGANKI